MKDEFNFPKISMNIILPAGDARTKADEAFNALLEGEEEKCNELLKQANECIKQAHKAQTDVLQTLAQREYEGDKNDVVLPMLFIHAQDTIMTIISEVNMIEKMVKLYKEIKKENTCKK